VNGVQTCGVGVCVGIVVGVGSGVDWTVTTLLVFALVELGDISIEVPIPAKINDNNGTNKTDFKLKIKLKILILLLPNISENFLRRRFRLFRRSSELSCQYPNEQIVLQ